MSAVADMFDRDGDGYIDYYEFIAALHPNKDAYKPLTDADKIEDEVAEVLTAAINVSVKVHSDETLNGFFSGHAWGGQMQMS